MMSSMGLIPSFLVLATDAVSVVLLIPVGVFRFRLRRLPFGRRRKSPGLPGQD